MVFRFALLFVCANHLVVEGRKDCGRAWLIDSDGSYIRVECTPSVLAEVMVREPAQILAHIARLCRLSKVAESRAMLISARDLSTL